MEKMLLITFARRTQKRKRASSGWAKGARHQKSHRTLLIDNVHKEGTDETSRERTKESSYLV